MGPGSTFTVVCFMLNKVTRFTKTKIKKFITGIYQLQPNFYEELSDFRPFQSVRHKLN